MSYLEPYRLGTISVASGSTAVTGAACLWLVDPVNPNIRPGDKLVKGSVSATIKSVEDNTHLTLEDGWPGLSLTDSSYKIERNSLVRASGVAQTDAISKILLTLGKLTPIYRVPADQDAPDPYLGENGQAAIKVSGSVWKMWIKEDDVWVYLGGLGFTPKGAWNNVTTFSIGDFVSDSGETYISLQDDNLNHAPSGDETDTAYWMWMPSGGEYGAKVFILNFSIGGRPKAAEIIDGHVFAAATDFPAGLGTSQAYARVAPTADAVINILLNDSVVGTVTFAAGENAGAVESGGAISAIVGDRLDLEAPETRDVTLSGIKIAIRGLRN
jgi:hypothetical protein